MTPVHILLYTLPGVPSIYYGSEFGIEGRKENFSDASLRPALNLDDYKDAVTSNPVTALIARLGQIRQHTPALSYGDYRELVLTNRQYAFLRHVKDELLFVVVNFDSADATIDVHIPEHAFDYLQMREKKAIAVDLLTKEKLAMSLKKDGRVWKIKL